jgi:MFS family permease
MGFSSMIVMWGMMSGPIIAGLLADHFGNYRIGFTVLALMSGLGSIFFILATKPTPPGLRPARVDAPAAGVMTAQASD